MKLLESIPCRWHDLFRKRRIAMLDATDNSEEWHVHLSPAGIFAALVALSLVLFVVILSLMAYTPVLEILPGYRTDASRSRENLIRNILRVDSMERVMRDMMTYNENIALILDGKTPVVRTLAAADSARISKVLVMPSPEDSLLRLQMEGEGPYALKGDDVSSRRLLRESMELVSPAEGIITSHFDIPAGNFGVRLATNGAGERVMAIENGTVILSQWSPETGYVTVVQHGGNLLSVYKNLSQSLVRAGQTVKSGELIGYTPAEGDGRLFEFELWNGGKPVDPEGYIVF